MIPDGSELAAAVRKWQSDLRSHASALRSGAEQWRASRPDVDVLVEKGAQWIDPTFEYVLPHAALILDYADAIEQVADALDAPAEDAQSDA